MKTLPNDDTGNALKCIEENGSDLTKPLTMDFFIAVSSKSNGDKVANEVKNLGYQTSVEFDEETDSWTCYCTKTMIPTYPSVVASEQELDMIAQKYSGYIDGFGSYGNG